jgi:hypothetical protein
MISEKTIHRLHSVYDGIEDCKQALTILKGKKKIDYPVLNVSLENDEKGGISIILSNAMAKESIEKQLKVLGAEFVALQSTALSEIKSGS